MEKHFTATAYIIDRKKVLLVFHRKFQKWLPPGGHLDPNESPPECVIREAKEETGYDIELVRQENVWINRWNSNSFERPYLCMMHEVPAHNGTPAHQHMDMIYLARLIGGEGVHRSEELEKMKWFALSEIEELRSDIDIFEETKQAIRHILSRF